MYTSKHVIKKMKMQLPSGPITLWQRDGETMETVTEFIFLGSKITVDGDCSHEIKGRFKPWQHVKNQRHYFVDKVPIAKAMVFPVIMYGCESWTIRKAEHWRTDAFELWCWRRLLESHGLQGDQNNQSSRKSALNVH